MAPHEASIERAIIERKGASEGAHLKHLDVPDQVFQRAVDAIRGILQAAKTQVPFSMYSAEEAADLLLPNLQESDALLVHVFTPGAPPVDPALEAVNVCILAVKFGLELGYTGEELRQLSLAALLHDVGMARLPEGLVEKNGPLNPVERASLGRHPEAGAQIIRRLGPDYTWLAEVIIQSHERVDGSGYPKALKGTDIHEYAQIVGLADVYESLVHHRPFRRRLSPLEALKEILSRERTTFPDRVLKALIQALSPYPVGSLVRLNTGEIAQVVAKDKDRPLRPVVEVLIRGGKRLEEPVLTDLSQIPLLNVQDSLAEETLA
ncbi:MAG: HD-GYP domain-containing protein [Nitrospinota bacterium]